MTAAAGKQETAKPHEGELGIDKSREDW